MSGKVYAVIVAAGRGQRFGADLPKQFCDLGGRPMLMTTIERIAQVVDFQNIVIAIDPTMKDFWLELCKRHGFRSPKIAHGGATRCHSVANALCVINDADPEAIVMVHDGARPLASKALIERMSHLPEGFDGAIPAVPVSDSLRRFTDSGRVSSQSVSRSEYVAVQTPQSFRLNQLREAYRKALADDLSSLTDDASVIETVDNGRIHIAEGEPTNIKVTNPFDLALAETILKSQR